MRYSGGDNSGPETPPLRHTTIQAAPAPRSHHEEEKQYKQRRTSRGRGRKGRRIMVFAHMCDIPVSSDLRVYVGRWLEQRSQGGAHLCREDE